MSEGSHIGWIYDMKDIEKDQGQFTDFDNMLDWFDFQEGEWGDLSINEQKNCLWQWRKFGRREFNKGK